MLDTLRRGATGWLAKILMGLLVVSFAVWGIADIFRGYGASALATVGGREISAEDYRLAYQFELRALGRQLGRNLTPEEARAIGLESRVLSRLIAEAAVEAHGRNLNLGISEQAIVDDIMSEPAFQDSTGRFSRRQFQEILRNNGLSERAYVAHERESNIRTQLTRTMGMVPAVSQTLLDAANKFQNETRVLRYMSLPAAKLDPIPAPSDAELKTYYEEHKQTFTSPEYRKVGAILVTPESVAPIASISEEDAKAYFQTHKANFGTPEKRRVLQITFPDKVEAQQAHTKLKEGADFMELAKQRGLAEGDVDLGVVTKGELADPMVAETAFKLEKNAVSDPVQGGFGVVLLKVTEVEAEVAKGFEELVSDIRQAISRERAQAAIHELQDKIEDMRAGGSKLAEIASNLKLTYKEIETTQNGTGRDGAPLKDTKEIPELERLITAAFTSEVGFDIDPIDTSGRGVMWVEVLGVAPAQLKPFDTVKPDVEKEWRTAEERSRLAKKAQDLIAEVRGGKSFSDAAKSLSLEVKESEPLKRTATREGLPRTAVAQAFALSEHGLSSTPTEDGKSRVIFQITKVTPPPPLEAKDAESLNNALRSQATEDRVSQYVSGLRDSYGVSINRSAFDKLIGRDGG